MKLLSEINAVTELLYVPLKNVKYINQYFDGSLIKTDYVVHLGFCQDPVVMLYDEKLKNINLINSIGWTKGSSVILKWKDMFKSKNLFIEELKKRNIKTTLNALNAYVPIPGEEERIKLDEIKRDFQLESVVSKHQDIIFPVERFKNIFVDSEEENDKGGNYISDPTGKIIFYVDHKGLKMPNEFKKCNNEFEFIPLKCSFKNNDTFRHIDEIMCFMPLGEGTFEVWLYEDNNFKTESASNKKLIEDRLGKEPGFKGIRTFEIEYDANYLFKAPPLFNRLFIETKEEIQVLIPDNLAKANKKTSVSVDGAKINLEEYIIKYVKSFSGSTKILKVDFVDTTLLHNTGKGAGDAGGNLHCLIKQVLRPF